MPKKIVLTLTEIEAYEFLLFVKHHYEQMDDLAISVERVVRQLKEQGVES